MKKQGSLVLGSSAVLAAALLAGCSSNSAHLNSVGVCVDKKTQKRVDDSKCDHQTHTGTSSPSWVYYNSGHRIPAVGAAASGYSTAVPKGIYAKGGYAAQGGSFDGGSSNINGKAPVFDGTGAKAGSAGKAQGSVARGGFAAHGGGEGGHGG